MRARERERERCITQQNYVPRSVGSWPSLVYALLCGGSRYKRGFTVRQLVRTIFTDHYRWLRSPPTSLLRRTTLDQPCLNLGSVLVLWGVPTVYWMGAHQSPLPVRTGLSLWKAAAAGVSVPASFGKVPSADTAQLLQGA